MLTPAGARAEPLVVFCRATAGEQIVPKPGIVGTQTLVTLPPAACRHVPPPSLATCVERLGELRAHEFDLHVLLIRSGVALVVMAAFAFALGWLVAGRVLRPLRAITATARRISATTGEIGRLLQPFQRLATARTSNGDGHGLGLAIVAAIATAHGATLVTQAQPEGGLHVQVSFPVRDAGAVVGF